MSGERNWRSERSHTRDHICGVPHACNRICDVQYWDCSVSPKGDVQEKIHYFQAGFRVLGSIIIIIIRKYTASCDRRTAVPWPYPERREFMLINK